MGSGEIYVLITARKPVHCISNPPPASYIYKNDAVEFADALEFCSSPSTDVPAGYSLVMPRTLAEYNDLVDFMATQVAAGDGYEVCHL